MSNWLQKIQQKPKAVRNQYAFFGAVVVTALIALIWVAGNSAGGINMSGSLAEVKKEQNGAFASFVNDVKEQAAAAWQSVEQNQSTEPTPSATSTPATTTLRTKQPVVVLPKLTKPSSSTTASTTPARDSRPILIGTTTREHTY